MWNGNLYTESGIYTYSLQTDNGCDSVGTLNLIINDASTITQDITACESYEWNSAILTQSGTYTQNTTLNNYSLSFDGVDDYIRSTKSNHS